MKFVLILPIFLIFILFGIQESFAEEFEINNADYNSCKSFNYILYDVNGDVIAQYCLRDVHNAFPLTKFNVTQQNGNIHIEDYNSTDLHPKITSDLERTITGLERLLEKESPSINTNETFFEIMIYVNEPTSVQLLPKYVQVRYNIQTIVQALVPLDKIYELEFDPNIAMLANVERAQEFDIQESYAENKKANIGDSLLELMEYADEKISNFPIFVDILTIRTSTEDDHVSKVVNFIQENQGSIVKTNIGEYYGSVQARIPAYLIKQLSEMPENVHSIGAYNPTYDRDKIRQCLTYNGGQFSYSVKHLRNNCGFSHEDIQCKTGFFPIQKKSNGITVCVTPMSAMKLFEMGFTDTDYRKSNSIPDIEIAETKLQEMKYSETVDLKIHEELLISHYISQGITLLDVNYEILDMQSFGESCEGSFTIYEVTVLTSNESAEKLQKTNLSSYIAGIDRCGMNYAEVNLGP